MEVTIGTEVKVRTSNGSTRIFKLVEPSKVDPKSGLISDQSPVGKALLGHQEGDEVSVTTPGGVVSYIVLSVKLLPGEKYLLLAQSHVQAAMNIDLLSFSGYINHCWRPSR